MIEGPGKQKSIERRTGAHAGVKGADHRGKRYNGEIVAGSLLIWETRKIARLLLDRPDPAAWRRAIVIDNILRKRGPVTAKRQARLIRNRLDLMQPALWKLIAEGGAELAAQATLAAAIKHSRLIGDFMDTVIRDRRRTFIYKISVQDWKDFLDACAQLDPGVNRWTDATRTKLRQIVFKILVESGYIENVKSLRIIPVSLYPEIREHLLQNSEDYVLRCMTAAGGGS
ncbi:MAG: DUF1819 family protein [Desulfobacterales bacterium]|nr:DUF1819 family protein [Desulfobacterales bacterium]